METSAYLPTMHFKPTGIEGCEGLWVGKLLAQMVKKYFKTRKFYILQVKESFTHNLSFLLQVYLSLFSHAIYN